MTHNEYLMWLKAAAADTNGIRVSLNDRNLAWSIRAKLYRIREEERQDGVSTYDGLTFRIVGGDLVIAHKKRLPPWNDKVRQFECSGLSLETLSEIPHWPTPMMRDV